MGKGLPCHLDCDFKMEPYKRKDWLPFYSSSVSSHFATPLCCKHRAMIDRNVEKQNSIVGLKNTVIISVDLK